MLYGILYQNQEQRFHKKYHGVWLEILQTVCTLSRKLVMGQTLIAKVSLDMFNNSFNHAHLPVLKYKYQTVFEGTYLYLPR